MAVVTADAASLAALFAAHAAHAVHSLLLSAVRGLPKTLRKDVQRFYESEWLATGGSDDLAMLRTLPLSLQSRAIFELYGNVLEAVPFVAVRVHDLRFWRILLRGLEHVSYMEGKSPLPDPALFLQRLSSAALPYAAFLAPGFACR